MNLSESSGRFSLALSRNGVEMGRLVSCITLLAMLTMFASEAEASRDDVVQLVYEICVEFGFRPEVRTRYDDIICQFDGDCPTYMEAFAQVTACIVAVGMTTQGTTWSDDLKIEYDDGALIISTQDCRYFWNNGESWTESYYRTWLGEHLELEEW